MKKFKKLMFPPDFPYSRVFNNAQEHVESVINPVLDSAIIDGVLLEDIALVSGSFTSIEHKLGRKPRGYLVIRKSAAETVYEDVGDYDNRKLFIKLRASGSVTVNLWVF